MEVGGGGTWPSEALVKDLWVDLCRGPKCLVTKRRNLSTSTSGRRHSRNGCQLKTSLEGLDYHCGLFIASTSL